MKNWEVLKCDNCGAPMKPSGRTATCEYCSTVYVRDTDFAPDETSPRSGDFILVGAPDMSSGGWTLAVDGVNPLAFGEAPPLSGEEGWIDSFGNRYSAF